MSKISSKEFNKKRRDLLIQKDENKCLTNIDLGMYDLTPYFSPSQSPTLFEQIMLYENSQRQIRHISDKEIFFSPEQEDALNFISQKDNIIFSAPTSFGKTLILKEYIYRNKPDTVVFIVPTNALAYELENDFKKNTAFEDYEIFDKCLDDDVKTKKRKTLFVGTQEKYKEISSTLENINLFVIDEAYKLQESTKKQRGYALSQTFLESISGKSSKIILLSPNANFIGFEKYNFSIYETQFNAVDRVFTKLEKSRFYDVLFEKAKSEKTILYCDSPNKILAFEEKAPILTKNKNEEFIRFLEDEFHPEWSVVKLLKKGILTHHGLMPKFVQNKMIGMFVNNEECNLLVGTNSISEGINTPTKNLFFDESCNPSKDRLLYKNTIGRAGRLGKYPIGHIYSLFDLSDIDTSKISIELAVSNDEELEEVSDSSNSSKIKKICDDYAFDEAFFNEKLKPLQLSLNKIKKTIDVLSMDLENMGLFQLPNLAAQVFESDYPNYQIYDDQLYIRGTLQDFYYDENYNKIPLNSYSSKINFFLLKAYHQRIYNPSKIIEGYMKFTFSTLEYYIMPIMRIAKIIHEQYPKWHFGKNVVETMEDFFQKYYSKIYGLDADELTDNQNKILSAIKEFGISIKKAGITKDILVEIEQELTKRFSTFDVINAIKRLTITSKYESSVYQKIVNKYI